MFTERIPPTVEKTAVSKSLTKNIRESLKVGINTAVMHKKMQRQRPQISPLTSPPEFFLNADIKPPAKADK